MRREQHEVDLHACSLAITSCALCDEHGAHAGPHRALVNAAATAMFWGTSSAMHAILSDADRSSSRFPGFIQVSTIDDSMRMFLWLTEPHELAIARTYWCDVLEDAAAWFTASVRAR